MSLFTAETAFVKGAIVGPTTVIYDEVITEVRPWVLGDPRVEPGLFLPGLVNAHTHLELSWAAGQIPKNLGFERWVQQLLALERPVSPDLGIAGLLHAGTAAVSDICNGPSTAESLAASGLCGIVQRELFGMDHRRLPALLERAAAPPERTGCVVARSSPHALYSTPPALLAATIEAPGFGHPASIHLAEHASELCFVEDGSGGLGPQLDAWGLQWRPYQPYGTTPVGALKGLGLLHDLLLVHGVLLNDADRALIAGSGCTVVLCPRSNLHISGLMPDVPALLSANIPLALGTDSLASSPDLDVLGEVELLTQMFPAVPLCTWLGAATAGGADALGLPVGRLQVGTAPKLLRVHPERPWSSREVCVG